MDLKILFFLEKLRLQNKGLRHNLPYSFLFLDRKKIDDVEKTVLSLPKKSAIIIREYDLNTQEKEDFAKKIIKLAKKNEILCFIAKDIELALKLDADGLHFSDFDKIPVSLIKKFHKKFIISMACHSEKSLRKINNSILAKNIDVIFFSPIFPTSSHENTRLIGLRNFNKIANNSKKYLYPLGGINEKNAHSLLKNKKTLGFGGISLFKNLGLAQNTIF